MRTFKHWTPHYIFSRIGVMIDYRLNPDHPWLTRHAVGLLGQLLRPDDIGLEFGSGRSTRWISRRVKKLTSVEHDARWHALGLERLTRETIENVDLFHRPLDCPVDAPHTEDPNASYVRVLDNFTDASLDFCLVDGMYRGHCAIGALPKIRAGGLVVIDNCEWFLPSPSRSPGVRSPDAGPAGDAWRRFAEETKNWRRIWTTNGVWDTLFLFKP